MIKETQLGLRWRKRTECRTKTSDADSIVQQVNGYVRHTKGQKLLRLWLLVNFQVTHNVAHTSIPWAIWEIWQGDVKWNTISSSTFRDSRLSYSVSGSVRRENLILAKSFIAAYRVADSCHDWINPNQLLPPMLTSRSRKVIKSWRHPCEATNTCRESEKSQHKVSVVLRKRGEFA